MEEFRAEDCLILVGIYGILGALEDLVKSLNLKRLESSISRFAKQLAGQFVLVLQD